MDREKRRVGRRLQLSAYGGVRRKKLTMRSQSLREPPNGGHLVHPAPGPWSHPATSGGERTVYPGDPEMSARCENGAMDWSIVHSLNGFLYHNDPVEDPLLWYVKAAEALYLLLLVVLFLVARQDRFAPIRRAAVAAGLSAGLGLLVVKIITEFYDRARPFVAHPGAIHLFARHAADASFPSDHATASMAIAVAFLLRGRRFWGILTFVFAVILDFGRVAAGFHYPTDVLAGAAIGALAALLLWSPPVRSRIDALADLTGGWWDQAVDLVLKRIQAPRTADPR